MLRPGGRMALTTIEPARGLSDADRRRAHRAGPVAVAVRTSYPSLFRSAGFVETRHRNVTAEYRATLDAWLTALERREARIVAAVGRDVHDDRIPERFGR